MSGQIVRPKVRLDFHDPADTLGVDQIFPKQVLGNRNRVPVVE